MPDPTPEAKPLPKMYAQRDPKALGEHYFRHVDAMTRERLYEKCHIAAELAYRDSVIQQQAQALTAVRGARWRRFGEERPEVGSVAIFLDGGNVRTYRMVTEISCSSLPGGWGFAPGDDDMWMYQSELAVLA